MPINPDRLKSRLENKALHYLGRYASSEANLRQILKRFAMRKCQPTDADDDDADADRDAFRQILETEIDALITRYRALGYVDDRGFALGRARAMRARGASTRRIIQTLKAKGIDAKIASEIMADGLETLSADADTNTNTNTETLSPETTAARIYAQRRRLGQYASPASQAKPNWKDRHLASMMRAGFNYATAKSALFDAD